MDLVQLGLRLVIGILQGLIGRIGAGLHGLGEEGLRQIAQTYRPVSGHRGVSPHRHHGTYQGQSQWAQNFLHHSSSLVSASVFSSGWDIM